jgi:hypothetical protein
VIEQCTVAGRRRVHSWPTPLGITDRGDCSGSVATPGTFECLARRVVDASAAFLRRRQNQSSLYVDPSEISNPDANLPATMVSNEHRASARGSTGAPPLNALQCSEIHRLPPRTNDRHAKDRPVNAQLREERSETEISGYREQPGVFETRERSVTDQNCHPAGSRGNSRRNRPEISKPSQHHRVAGWAVRHVSITSHQLSIGRTTRLLSV